MSDHVLLNLLIKLVKRDKMRGLRIILPFFATSLINSINTKAHMLDSIYHMTLSLL